MRKTIPTNLYYNFLVATLFVLGTVSTGFSQCPTVTNAAQSFCDVEAPMVSSLKATNTGGGIAWYATRNSTTPLSNTTGLIHDTVYFAGSPTCSFADRQEVSVTIYGPPAALGFQGPCVDTPNEATISSLFATGNDIQWYNVPFGGTPLAATTILKDNTIYYVDQSNPITGCRSSRRSVLVSVGVVPVPTGEAIQEFCADSEPTVANLVASGNNRWYSTKSSGTALDINTPLVDGESYFATTFTEICESYDRLEVVVDFIAPNDSGLAGTIDLCLTDLSSTGTVNLFDALGGTPATNGKWRGPFTTSNGNQGTVSVTTMTVEGSPYVFSYDVTSDSCPTSTTNVSVTVVLPPDPGTNGTLMVCSNDSPIDLFGSLGGTPDTGGTWSPALTSGSGIFDPSTDAAGIYTYTVAGTATCAEASATVEVQISPEPNPGTNGAVILCVDSSSENLFTYLGGSPETGGTWSPMLASGTGVFDPAKDTAGTYTYTVSGIDPCGDASASVTVTVNPLPDAGTSANLLLCANDTPQDLFNSLGGTPDAGGTWSPALNSGSGIFDPAIDSSGIYTYTVQGTAPCGETSATVSVTINPEAEPGTNGTLIVCIDGTPENLFDSLGGTSQTGGTWSPALASGTGIFDPAKDAAGIYTYTVSGMDPCGDASASVTVTVNPLPDAGANGNLVLCSNDAPQDLFNSLGGTPETGGTWSPALASGSGMFNPSVDTAGVYTYTVAGISPCGEASATVTVKINPEAEPGTNGTLIVCADGSPEDLFMSLGGTPQTGGTWSPALASGTGIFDPAKDAAGIYTYSVSGITPCGDSSSTVTVTVNPLSNAGTNGNLVLCSNDAPQDLFNSLGGTPETGGTWSPALASGSGMFNPSVDTAGVYTYTVAGISPCGEASATVTVKINPEAEPGMNGTLIVCADGGPEDLFASLGGTPQTGGTWSPALASGSSIFDPTKDEAGIYTYSVSGITPCGDSSSTVTVTVNPLPNAGTNGNLVLCSNDAPQDLFNSLGGTAETGGTWSPTLASGSGIFNPSVDVAGTYTYTVIGDAPCGEASAMVTVTINPEAEPGTNGTLILCADGSPEDLFMSLGGTPQTDGTWSPALASGTNIFDPAKDAAGVYTYSVSGITPCGNSSATVTVTVNPIVNAGSNGTLELCSTDEPQNLVNSLGGTPDLNGTWSPALASGTGMFDPSKDTAGLYTYTVGGAAPCGDATATVNVTVTPAPQAGTNSSLSICVESAPENLFNKLGGSPQPGGIWSPSLASGTGVFDPSKDKAGVYTYTVAGNGSCEAATATVSVTIDNVPNAGGDAIVTICTNDAPQDLIESLSGTPDAGGIWSPALASGTGVFDPSKDSEGTYTYTVTTACGVATATVSVTTVAPPNSSGAVLSAQTICINDAATIVLSGATQLADATYKVTYSLTDANSFKGALDISIVGGNATFTIPAVQLPNAGLTTFTLTDLIDPITNCGITSLNVPSVQFNVDEAQTPQLVTDGNSFCLEDAPTIADLTNNLIGIDTITWYDASENGTAYDADTTLENGTTYYASNSTVSGCTSSVRLEVTVSIERCEPLVLVIPDGFSPNGDAINDEFVIKNLSELYPNFKLQIYNRYGNILYKGDINTPNWDGTSNQGREVGNGVLPVGVYYFILEFNDQTTKTIQGRVYLNR